MLMDYHVISKKSTERDDNQDNYVDHVTENHALFAVADGVGGLAFGDVASKRAVEVFSQLTIPPTTSLELFFEDANKQILKESEQRNRLMGSTLVSVMINLQTHEISIAHVGDSRAYIFSQHGMWHTQDDTLVQELVEMGIITEEQAFDHPNKNRLNKALGSCDELDVNTYSTTLLDSSTILLCTDGLHDYVRDEEIRMIALTESPEDAAKHLVRKARKNNSKDDITIIIATL